MAIIFCDGFDHYDRGRIHNKWDYNGGSPWHGECYIEEGLGRFGTNALSLKDSWQRVFKAMPHGPLSYVTAGVAINPSSGLATAPAMILTYLTGTTYMCGVAVSATNNLYYWSGQDVWYANKPLRANAYNYVELQIDRFHGVCGTVRVWLNEVKVLELIYVNTNGGTPGSPTNIHVAEAVMLGGHASWVRTDYPSPGILFDDFYLTDSTGDSTSECLGNLGDVRIIEQMPIADHDHEWDISESIGDNYEMVDDAADDVDDDGTYITSQVVDTKDTYEFPELPVRDYDVKSVCMNFYAKKLDSGTRGVSMVAHRGTTYVASDENRIGGNYVFYQSFMEYDIDGNTWTIPNVESTYFGPKLTA